MGDQAVYTPAEGAVGVIKFAREPYTSALEVGILPLASEHFREVRHFDDIEFAPSFDAYEQAQDADRLRVFIARDSSIQEPHKNIVGYAIFTVARHPHAMESLQAVQDSLYLDPKLRGFGIGSQFIEFCDEELKADGVQVVLQHVTTKYDFSKSLKKLGYELVDSVYGRRLA